MTHSAPAEIFTDWLTAVEARHLAELRVPEVTRALRALSSAYVERRHKVASGSTLDTAGKRAAFALYYAPLHFVATQTVVGALGAAQPAPESIVDIGCGTGSGGAAWALAAGGEPTIIGIDRHPWAVAEARWTYRQLRLRGDARQGDAAKLPPLRAGTAAIAAYALNELPDVVRQRVEDQLIEGAARGARALVIEPIARSITPWWEGTAARVRAAGGRADEWKFSVAMPPLVVKFGQAAGLNYRELRLRTLYL